MANGILKGGHAVYFMNLLCQRGVLVKHSFARYNLWKKKIKRKRKDDDRWPSRKEMSQAGAAAVMGKLQCSLQSMLPEDIL